tara:strand:+ start:509 stop:775 length:267 start_codon:yes stop_codon:yes gene_type:complete
MKRLDTIKKIAQDIMDENEEWVNDSHSAHEHAGIVSGLNQLISRLENDDSESAYNKLEHNNTILKTQLSLCLKNSEHFLKELQEINKN